MSQPTATGTTPSQDKRLAEDHAVRDDCIWLRCREARPHSHVSETGDVVLEEPSAARAAVADTCPTCGSSVTVVSTDESTSHYQPAVALTLDEAWAEAEAALPEGWVIHVRRGWTVQYAGIVHATPQQTYDVVVMAPDHDPVRPQSVGLTLADALRGLAARIRELQ